MIDSPNNNHTLSHTDIVNAGTLSEILVKGDNDKLSNHSWDDSDYYMNPNPVTDGAIHEVERELGYKLPMSYIELIKTQNGGTPVNTCFRTNTATSWAENHIEITAIHGIGGMWGIDSKELGSKFMIEEWGYPDIGIVICSCPSAGHDAVMLDYSECGSEGEPRLIHVDVETFGEPKITYLADSFESFISSLVNECEIQIEEQSLENYNVLDAWIDPDFEELLKKNKKKEN